MIVLLNFDVLLGATLRLDALALQLSYKKSDTLSALCRVFEMVQRKAEIRPRSSPLFLYRPTRLFNCFIFSSSQGLSKTRPFSCQLKHTQVFKNKYTNYKTIQAGFQINFFLITVNIFKTQSQTNFLKLCKSFAKSDFKLKSSIL